MIFLIISFVPNSYQFCSDIHKLFFKIWIILAKEPYHTCIIKKTYLYKGEWGSIAIVPAPKMITLTDVLLSEKFENLKSKLDIYLSS